MTRDFFVDLFLVDIGVCPTQVLSHNDPKVSDSMNEGLCKEFTEKIFDACF
jgi:hypothetical protein